jgi:uncharacterized protein (DUF1499 family)
MKRVLTIVALCSLMMTTGACSAISDPMDLRAIERSSAPRDALACPPGLCAAAVDIESPVVAGTPADLVAKARDVLSREPRTELVSEDKALMQLVFVQRSALLRFPDTVRVQAIAVGDGASVMIHSTSNYGYWDMGVNRDRVERWLRLVTGPR